MTTPLKKIVIVGPGAMGCLFAGMLNSPETDLWLLDKDTERASAINNQGIQILRDDEKLAVPVKATARPAEIGTADLAVICVKSYDTGSAARLASQVAGEGSLILTLQNGMGNVEQLAEVFGPEKVLGGTTAQGANLVDTGKVRHAGEGETVIGELAGGTSRAEKVAGFMSSRGLSAKVTTDLEGVIWSKLIINVAINALTAVLGVRNGVLAETEATREIMEAAIEEVKQVCRARGITLSFEDPFERALQVSRATGQNISSMLQDVRAKRQTEIEAINAAVVAEAAGYGIEAPVNSTLSRLVRAMEQTREKKL
ncbi:MAG: 2-dehydropantoate 2-reductase [bacterium]